MSTTSREYYAAGKAAAHEGNQLEALRLYQNALEKCPTSLWTPIFRDILVLGPIGRTELEQRRNRIEADPGNNGDASFEVIA